MLCPLCEYQLQHIEGKTDSGSKYAVEHCGRCGGTWFDPYEMHRIPYHDIMKIADLSVQPKKPSFSSHRQLCPRCHKNLELVLQDVNPAGISFYRCPQCRGMWATQKTIEEFGKIVEGIPQVAKEAPPSPLSIMFTPTLILLLLFASTFATVISLQNTREERIQATAIISTVRTTALSPTQLHIWFKTKSPVTSKVTVKTNTFDAKVAQVSTKPSLTHSAVITGLKAKTPYAYTITLTDENGRQLTTKEYYIVTP